ncbi:TldD/PmbA family protein [Ectothiorhodospiraceae bacterium 2226]|nr:TldD/PmbA family protein [Ectothiorhodospiraceae bacterium 2226]
MLDTVERLFASLRFDAEFCALRVVREHQERIVVRRGVVQPLRRIDDFGAMLTVIHAGGVGYAATTDLTRAGLEAAFARARAWAEVNARWRLVDPQRIARAAHRGEYASAVVRPWEAEPLAAKIERVRAADAALGADSRVVDREASVGRLRVESLQLNTAGGRIAQRFEAVQPHLRATAHRKGETQTRTLGTGSYFRQGGLELLDALEPDEDFEAASLRVREEALELLGAPDCPAGIMDLVLAPDQMVLQIHESIGHPLELDRILGDERNYAGTSFVTPEMFGSYQYGSPLLNVTFDPGVAGELASYAYDDEGAPAERTYLIREGVLLRPLGGSLSQARAGMAGVAAARASGWNRPPIDRMANLNLEPGDASLGSLIAQVEQGVYMQTNCSWSIDDSRNKFQFGCERARRIVNGELREVVKNPNYRGISSAFWRNLAGVGNADSFRVLGVGNCGKGEPNQMVRVGHATPPCLFRAVDVFGGG